VSPNAVREVTSARPSRVRQACDASPLRVLHVINGEHYAGAERVQDSLARRLPEHGFEIGFACVKPGQFSLVRQFRETPLANLPMRWRFDLRPVPRLVRLIRRESYALVHTHNPRTALVGGLAASLAGVPLVHHVHTQTHLEFGGRWMSRLSAAVERRSVARAAGLIGVSESIGRYLRAHGYARRHIWIVPNGTPVSETLPFRPRPNGTWTVGLVALFRPRKGLEVMLEAMAWLREAGIYIRLRAVGRFETSSYESDIRRYAARLGVAAMIDWTGFRSDVRAELKQMDIFVLPSLLAEGLPMSVLEAMSVGTTIVATRVDGVTDLIRDGEDGLLAASGDPDDLARVLAAVICGRVDCDRLRTSARRRHAERFSDQSMAAGVTAVYRAVLRERGQVATTCFRPSDL
jgi:glycosyltransferase involved in cell wall biosynthesis